MNLFQYATSRILRGDIPRAILQDAFRDDNAYGRRNRRSVEDCIEEKVLREVVMEDLSKIGGVMKRIELNAFPYEKLNDYSRIYTLPLAVTGGREIVQAMRVALNVTSNYAERVPGQSTDAFTVSPYERSIQSVISSHKPIPNVTNGEVEILGNNVIKINDYQNFSVDIQLEMLLGYTPDFRELKKPYWGDFLELSNMATKGYIFRELALELDRTRLEGGRDFGRYKEFVDGFSDANQMYLDTLDKKWYTILLLNDPLRKNKRIMSSGVIKA